MILSMTGQAKLFLLVSSLGFASGLFFDIFRILRRTFKHPDFLTYIEDMLYWLAVTTLVYYFVLNKNNGEIRVFLIIGMFLGMVIYFCSLSIIVFNISVAVINFIKKAIKLAIKMILAPFKLLFKIASIPVRWVYGLIAPIAIRAGTGTKKGLKKTARYAKIKTKNVFRELKIISKKI